MLGYLPKLKYSIQFYKLAIINHCCNIETNVPYFAKTTIYQLHLNRVRCIFCIRTMVLAECVVCARKMQFPALVCTILAIVLAVNGDGMEQLELPEAQHNLSSILCIIKFCEKYFRSEKKVIGSLVIVNVQNTTEFHSELIIMVKFLNFFSIFHKYQCTHITN